MTNEHSRTEFIIETAIAPYRREPRIRLGFSMFAWTAFLVVNVAVWTLAIYQTSVWVEDGLIPQTAVGVLEWIYRVVPMVIFIAALVSLAVCAYRERHLLFTLRET